MPFNVTERDISGRLPVQPNDRGGYSVAQRPNPNSGESLYKQNNPAVAGLGAPGQWLGGGNAGMDRRNPLSTQMLSQAADDTDRGDLAQHAGMRQHMVDQGNLGGAQAMNQNMLDQQRSLQQSIMGGDWRLQLQALQNVGANKLQTGAKAGMDLGAAQPMGGGNYGRAPKPGFFDTQQTSAPMNGAPSNSNQALDHLAQLYQGYGMDSSIWNRQR